MREREGEREGRRQQWHLEEATAFDSAVILAHRLVVHNTHPAARGQVCTSSHRERARFQRQHRHFRRRPTGPSRGCGFEAQATGSRTGQVIAEEGDLARHALDQHTVAHRHRRGHHLLCAPAPAMQERVAGTKFNFGMNNAKLHVLSKCPAGAAAASTQKTASTMRRRRTREARAAGVCQPLPCWGAEVCVHICMCVCVCMCVLCACTSLQQAPRAGAGVHVRARLR